ncbi:MAG: glycosyltransferase family 4 protein [Ignisphaera sp.]
MDNYVVVAHRFWGRPGGSQLVCAAAAYAFDVMGFTPVLASPVKVDVSGYADWFGIDLKRYLKVSVYSVDIRAFGIYLRFLLGKTIKKTVERFGARIIFVDDGTYKPVEEFVRKEGVKLIEYIHFPYEITVNEKFKGLGLYYEEDPYVLERYSRFPMNIYWKIYVKLLPRYMRKNPFSTASLVLTNSRWTADLVKSVYGEAPAVLNPPIPPNTDVVERPRVFNKRENAVVMVGRFSEEKRYHWVIEEVLPRLRREVPNTKLYIFGGARTRTALNYLAKLEKIAAKNGFKTSRVVNADADVYLVPDAPRRTINMVMDGAKVFLHATINEHWGIAVAEAMARGLPVVLHKSGGAWSDLAEEGAYALGYTNLEEAVEAISKLLTDEDMWKQLSRHSIEKAKNLSLEKFAEKLSKMLARVL